MYLFSEAYSLLWDDNFWFANITTWESLANPPPGVYYPKTKDLLWPSLAIATLIVIVRAFLER